MTTDKIAAEAAKEIAMVQYREIEGQTVPKDAEIQIIKSALEKALRLPPLKYSQQDLAKFGEPTTAMLAVLRKASEDLTCGSPNGTHYCPNCDNSLFGIKADIDQAIKELTLTTASERTDKIPTIEDRDFTSKHSASMPWTKEYLLHTFGCSDIMKSYERIADAHNATLAQSDERIALAAKRLEMATLDAKRLDWLEKGSLRGLFGDKSSVRDVIDAAIRKETK